MKFKNNMDNVIFRLHYKYTLTLLLVFALYITAHQYISAPIDCIGDNAPSIPKDTLNLHCWTHSTYTVKGKVNYGLDITHPGVLPGAWPESVLKYQTYYRWIGLLLLLQAFLCYIPRYCWLRWEGGLINKLLPMDLHHPGLDDGERWQKRKRAILDYFLLNFNQQNDFYAFKFFFCEILNFVNVVGQFFLMNAYLGTEFTSYGGDVVSTATNTGNVIEPMQNLFPTTAKCTFNKYGGGGNIVRYDAHCILPLNLFNGVFYTVLWFWFILVACISGMGLLLRLTFICVPGIRKYFLSARTRVTDGSINWISQKGNYGDWFVLNQLGSNMDRLIFGELVRDLGVRLEGKMTV